MRGKLALAATCVARTSLLDIRLGLAYDVVIGITLPCDRPNVGTKGDTMIISTLNTSATNGQIGVDLYRQGASTEPFILRFDHINSIHITAADARRLQMQLASAIYEYDTDYEFRETA